MIKEPNSLSIINSIESQLEAVQRQLSDSINYTEKIDYSYPTVSKVYNSLFKELRDLNEDDVNGILNKFDNVEEGNFLPSGNFQCAVNLFNQVRTLRLMLQRLNSKKGNIIPACGPLGNVTCNQIDLIRKDFSNKNIFFDIPFTGYEEREEILREVVKESGLNAVIAKDKLTSNVILCKVCKQIQTCNYGVADISFGRHSVTYELGLMHGFCKKVCILLQDGQEKFTDIHGLEHIGYKGGRELSINLAKWLLENIVEVDKQALERFIESKKQELNNKGEILFVAIKSKENNPNESEKNDASEQFSNEKLNLIKSSIGKDKYFILSATPIILINDVVDISKEEIKKIILNPEKNRSSGWNMDFTSSGHFLKPTFEGLEKEVKSRSLKLFRNGYIEFKALVDDSFSWGMDKYKKSVDVPLFNPYAVIEYPVSFIRLLKELAQKANLTKSYIIKMAYFNCGTYSLRPYSIHSIGYQFGDDEKNVKLDNWVYEKTFKELNMNDDSEALCLIERFYNTFGFLKEAIPYFNSKFIFEPGN